MQKSTITLPVFLSFGEWVAAITLDLPHLNVPLPNFMDTWHDWCSAFIMSNGNANYPIPSKILYPSEKDWMRWALDFIATF